jgi:hypothetical protein
MPRKTRPFLLTVAGTLFATTSNAALLVFADVNGDANHDAIYDATPGATFSVSVYATEDGLHGGLASYGTEVVLASPLSIAGATPADQLANINSDVKWDLPEGKTVGPKIEVIDGSFFNSYTGTVHLFDMKLTAPTEPGSYMLSFKNVEPDATFDGFVGFSDGYVYDSEAVFQATQVNVVPLPAGLPLFVSALVGLAWRVRRDQDASLST